MSSKPRLRDDVELVRQPRSPNYPKQGLTEQRIRFVELYMATGDAMLAYEQAGYQCKTDAALAAAANRLLKDERIRAEISARVQAGCKLPSDHIAESEQMRPLVATREERQRFWTEAMRNEKLDMKHRLKASEYLAKTQGDFQDHVHIHMGDEARRSVREILGLPAEVIDITPGEDG